MSDYETNEMLDQEEVVEQEEGGNEQNESSVSREEFEATRAALAKANKEAAKRRAELKEREEKLKQFEGFDLDEIKTLKQKEQEREMRLAEEKGNVEKIKQHYQEELAKREESLNGRVKELEGSLEKAVVDSQLNAAMSELGAKAKFLTPLIRSNIRLDRNDAGDYVARVLDDDGTYRLNRNGDFMNPKEYVEELREQEEYGIFFNSRGQSGSGSQPAATGGKKPKVAKPKSQFSKEERRAFIADNGWDDWEALPNV